MSKNKYYSEINDKIKPFIDRYLDSEYSNLNDMPGAEEVEKIAMDIRRQMLKKYPELAEILEVGSGSEVQVAYYGCGYLLWGLLAGALLCRCRRCRCGRNCRCGRGCRR